MNRLAGRWLTLLFLLWVGALLVASLGLSRVSGWIPQAVLVVTGALLLWQSVLDLRRAPGPEEPSPAVTAPRRRGERAAVAWITALLLAVWLAGLVAGSALFCLAWMRWHAGERWFASLALAALVGLALWLVFGRLLGSALPGGLLGTPVF